MWAWQVCRSTEQNKWGDAAKTIEKSWPAWCFCRRNCFYRADSYWSKSWFASQLRNLKSSHVTPDRSRDNFFAIATARIRRCALRASNSSVLFIPTGLFRSNALNCSMSLSHETANLSGGPHRQFLLRVGQSYSAGFGLGCVKC